MVTYDRMQRKRVSLHPPSPHAEVGVLRSGVDDVGLPVGQAPAPGRARGRRLHRHCRWCCPGRRDLAGLPALHPAPLMRVCSCIACPAHPGSCPELVTKGRCPACSSTAEQQRGRRQQRGYDAGHDRLRARWKPKVEAGLVDCHAPTCLMDQRRIQPDADWDLGHDDDRHHRGPEHQRCNRSAGGKAAHEGQR